MYKLDKKDKEILYQLDINSRQSDSQIAKKVRLNKNTVWYRINRLVETRIIQKFVTLINPIKFGKSIYKLYIRLQDVTDETWESIKKYLISHKQVFWVVRCEGIWDVITAVWVRDPYEFYVFYIDFSTRFNKYILEKAVTNQIEVPFYSRSYFVEKEGVIKCTWGGEVVPAKIDQIDYKLLQILTINARIPSTELAKKLNTTPRIVSYRIKELIKKNVIGAFSILPNRDALGLDYYKVIFYLKNLTKHRENAFIDYCRRQGNVLYYIKTLGPWELELELEVRDHKHLNQITNLIRKEFNDIIRNYETILITEEYKGEYNTLQ